MHETSFVLVTSCITKRIMEEVKLGKWYSAMKHIQATVVLMLIVKVDWQLWAAYMGPSRLSKSVRYIN